MRYLTFVPKALYRSAKRSLKGGEKLWVVILLWGVVLWWCSFVLGGITFKLGFEEWGKFRFLPPVIHMVIFVLGLIFIFIYPFCLATALYRCFRNAPHIVLSVILSAIGLLLLVWHIGAAFWIFGASFSHFWLGIKQFSLIFGG